MADFNSELPVRTVNAGDVQVKLVDGTTPSQAAAVDILGNIATNLAKVGGTAVTLGQTTMASSLPVAIASNQSAITVGQATASSLNATVVQLTASNLNANVSQATAANLNATVAQPTAANLNATVVQATPSALNATVVQATPANLNATVVQATGTNLHVVVDSGTVSATQGTSPWVENLSQVGGSAIALGQTTMAASLPVTIASNQAAIPVSIAATATGTQKTTYSTSAAVAAGGTATNTYNVTAAKTLSLGKIWISGSGKLKAVVQTGPTASLVTQFVGFSSTANPNISIDMTDMPIAVPSTSTGQVVVTITNTDNQAQDVYSTIIGVEN